MLIKICGINDRSLAKSLQPLKPDIVGFIFVPKSPRCISLEEALDIKKAIPNAIKIVGVFQNQPLELVKKIAHEVGLDYVQLHGDESPSYCKELSVPLIKAVSLKDAIDQTTEVLNIYKNVCEYFLIDRKIQGEGEMVDLNQVNELSTQFNILLSGGLTPENISDVIGAANESILGVDVSGGVEDFPGVKNIIKIRNFIKKVRRYNEKN